MSRIPLPADQDIPEASWPVLKATEKQLGFIPNMHRALSLSPAVLNAVNGLQTALSRTLDATTRHGIAHAVTEANGCLTGNNHPPEGSSQLPSTVWLRGLRATCLNYGE